MQLDVLVPKQHRDDSIEYKPFHKNVRPAHRSVNHEANGLLDLKTDLDFDMTQSSNLMARTEPLHSRRERLMIMKWRAIIALRYARTRIEPILKRALDLFIVLSAFLFVLPLMLITAIAVKIDSPGPVFFGQTRVGRRGKLFTCYKFRSMSVDAEERKAALQAQNEADGPVFKIQNDPRVTRVGHIIRSLSIDELPQMLNVLKGDMSLVGPRPPLPQEVHEYEMHQLHRLEVTPGLTGLQQVSGRSSLDFERWIRLDLQYIEEQSLWGDIKIMFKTIPAVLLRRGAY